MLSLLHIRFDLFLCAPTCVAALGQLLHADDSRVRRAAVRLFSRFGARPGEALLPSLNQFVLELLTTLKSDPSWATKDQAATLLSRLNDRVVVRRKNLVSLPILYVT